MRKIPLILGVALLAVLAFQEIYDFFITNDGVRFYAAKPVRLLCVAIVAIVGGGIALVIGHLSRAWQRRVKLGGLAALTTTFAAFFVILLASLTTIEAEFVRWCAIALVASAIGMAILLFEFFQVWRRH